MTLGCSSSSSHLRKSSFAESGSLLAHQIFELVLGGLIVFPHLFSINASKMFLFLISCAACGSSVCRGLAGSSGHNLSIGLQNPLAHFISCTLGWTKDSSQLLFGEREFLLFLPEVAPIMTFAATQTGDVSFITCHSEMVILTMQTEWVSSVWIVSMSVQLHTTIPQWHWTVSFLHVFSDSFFDETDVKFSFVCTRCVFFQMSECSANVIATFL